MKPTRSARAAAVLTLLAFAATTPLSAAAARPSVNARAAVIVDARSDDVLYVKNPHLRLPPASTTKLMTALVVLERLPLDRKVAVSKRAASASPSRAGLTRGASYRAGDLLVAALVASSNDAAVALAEAVAGSEDAFAELMNRKAASLGMRNTRFVNASGLPDPSGRSQYSTAYDLTRLMREALRDRRVDAIMGITTTFIRGSDGKSIFLRSHNKMLWRTPKYVKGKTGWTYKSQHTFVGTDYSPRKRIAFAMLYSRRPWSDIEALAAWGLRRAGSPR